MADRTFEILLVGSDADEARRLQEMLADVAGSRFVVTHHAGLDAAMGALRLGGFDVALLDGGAEGAETMGQLRQAAAGTPILRLRDREPESPHNEHYVVKDGVRGRELAQAIRHAVVERSGEVERDALRRERDLLRTLIDNLPDHIYVKDAESRFLLNNAAHIEYLGAHSEEEIRGKTDLDVFPDGVGNAFYAEEREILRTGEPLIGREERNVDANGEEHWVSSTKVPRRDEAGRIIGLVGMSRDITARIRAEQKLQAQNAQLEAFARSEHSALEELKQAQSHLVEAEKLVGLGQMVAGIAHEINNPLAFVSNNIAVAQRDLKGLFALLAMYRTEADECLAKERPELLGRIREEAERIDVDYTIGNMSELMKRSRDGLERIRRIITDLRDFARLDDSDLQDADLNAGIASTVNIMAAGAARLKDVRIEQLLGEIPPVPSYPGKINQVVMNLLSNAIDASPPQATVTVRSRVIGEYVEVEVSDQGTGIDPAIRERIFDPFFTTKAPGAGTGLGLSISYGIVRDHRGEIIVESTPGQGATFIVRLPLRAG